MMRKDKRGEGGIAENTIVRLVIFGISLAILLAIVMTFAGQSDSSINFFSRLWRLW